MDSFYAESGNNASDQLTPLTNVKPVIAIDNSGSTGGKVLILEKTSAEVLSKITGIDKIIAWNTTAYVFPNLHSIKSTGGTSPSSFVNLITGTKFLVVYTDGEIDHNEMKRFGTMLSNTINDIPVIAILTTSSIQDITLQQLQTRVNMSVVESFLGLSNNVLILLCSDSGHKLIMRKGCFDFLPNPELTNEMLLQTLPAFDFNLLKQVNVPKPMASNWIKLEGISRPLDLTKIYAATSNGNPELPIEILQGLCNRLVIAKLDLGIMHQILSKMMRKATENPELVQIYKDLAEIAASGLAGSEQHKALLAKYKECKTKTNQHIDKKKMDLLHKLFSMIADYNNDKTTFVLGSNRANRANIITEEKLTNIGVCSVAYCPVLMDDADAAILIRKTDNFNIENFTGDYAMENPFEFGSWLSESITPGIFSWEFSQNLHVHPFTREPILGAIPLSHDPAVIMGHMSKIFGGNRELWHMVRGYLSMIATFLNKDDKWVQENKNVFVKQLRSICDKYAVTNDLKGGTEQKVPLTKAFQHVITNYATCLRDRSAGDIRAILKIVDLVLPEFKYSELKPKIIGMSNVIDTVAKLLVKHKNSEDMKQYLMEVDDVQHYVSSKTDLRALVAHIFWNDINGEYKLLKLQAAVSTALSNKKYGRALQAIYNGESIESIDQKIFEVAMPEPPGNNIHFSSEKYGQWGANGIDEHICVFCGEVFQDAQSKRKHTREQYGAYFYNGHRAILHVLETGRAKIDEPIATIFMKVKERLYEVYGDRAKNLHTQHAKKRIHFMINRIKEARGVNTNTNSNSASTSN